MSPPRVSQFMPVVWGMCIMSFRQVRDARLLGRHPNTASTASHASSHCMEAFIQVLLSVGGVVGEGWKDEM